MVASLQHEKLYKKAVAVGRLRITAVVDTELSARAYPFVVGDLREPT